MSKYGKYSQGSETRTTRNRNSTHTANRSNQNTQRPSNYQRSSTTSRQSYDFNPTVYEKSKMRREERVAEVERFDWKEDAKLYLYVFIYSILFFTILAISIWLIVDKNAVQNCVTYGAHYSWVFIGKFFEWCGNIMDFIHPIWVSLWN